MTRQQINDYATTAIALLLLTALYLYTTKQDTSQLLETHKQTVEQTQKKTKEVRQNASTIRTTQKQHDSKITEAVEKARDTVPDDIDALCDLANQIIRDSNSNKQ